MASFGALIRKFKEPLPQVNPKTIEKYLTGFEKAVPKINTDTPIARLAAGAPTAYNLARRLPRFIAESAQKTKYPFDADMQVLQQKMAKQGFGSLSPDEKRNLTQAFVNTGYIAGLTAPKPGTPDIEGAVIQKYGLTKKSKEAAFITKDGKMIKAVGDPDSHASMVGGYGTEDYLKQTNSIRYTEGSSGLNIQTAKPFTKAQRALLTKIVKRNPGKSLFVDYTPNQTDQLGRVIGGGQAVESGRFKSVANAAEFVSSLDKPSSYTARAIQKFGATKNINKATFITKDGQFIGGGPTDHAIIIDQAVPRSEVGMSSGVSRHNAFFGEGNIRVLVSRPTAVPEMRYFPKDYLALDISHNPQLYPEQMKAIERAMKGKTVTVDVHNNPFMRQSIVSAQNLKTFTAFKKFLANAFTK